MAPADGLDALDQRRAARSPKRRLPPPRHAKAEATPAKGSAPARSEPVEEATTALEPTAAPAQQAVKAPESTAKPELVQEPTLRRRSRVRATQVHLDEAAEDHLNELRKRAVLGDVDLTNSAVLRLALSELVERHGYDRIVLMFANDDGRIRRGRPRG